MTKLIKLTTITPNDQDEVDLTNEQVKSWKESESHYEDIIDEVCDYFDLKRDRFQKTLKILH